MNILDRLGYLTLVHMTCSLGSFETRLQEFFFFFPFAFAPTGTESDFSAFGKNKNKIWKACLS